MIVQPEQGEDLVDRLYMGFGAGCAATSVCPGGVGEVVLEASISCATCCISSLLSGMLLSRLFYLMAFGPVVFYVLQEFAVPGGVRLVAVLPVYDELGQQRVGEFGVDVRHAQDVEYVLGWLPVVGYALGLGAVLQAGGVFGPLDADVLDEL